MDIAPPWQVLLKEENQRLSLRNIRVLCLIAMTMVPLAVVLDYFAYNHLWPTFFMARALVSLIEIVLLGASYTALGQRHCRLLMLLVPLVPAVAIAWMIYCSGDPGSPYYAGLTLVLVGVGFLYQWSHVESMIAVGITSALYFAATVPLILSADLQHDSIGNFINNFVFLALNSIVIITGSLVHHRIRVREIVARYTLEENRKELEEKHLELIEMDRLKTDFFSNVTHELRTPLTLILAPLQRLLHPQPVGKTTAARLAGEDREEISGIYQNSLRLLKLINELLNLSSVDASRLRIEHREFSLDGLLDRITRTIRNVADKGGITLTQTRNFQCCTICGDEEKLEKILLNLLFNSVKFTPHGGRIVLKIEQRAAELVFEVADTGVGIPAGSLPFIFDRFWQADTSATRRHTGTGLGLSLVKEFAQAMDGSVEAESKVGQGTVIRVILPCLNENAVPSIGLKITDPESELAADTGDTSDQSLALTSWIRSIHREADQAHVCLPHKLETDSAGLETEAESDRNSLPLVLIADDEPDMLRFMRRELEAKYRIVEAADGAAAHEAALRHRPDLVIADYMMPNLDGLALCRELRSSETSSMTPIMLVTARSDETVRLNALHLGANDVLVKPFSLSEFNSRVHNLVENRLLQNQVEARNVELEGALGELRAAERELVQSEKMAALGILTAGIMHEVNNPLNFVRSALYVLERRTSKLPAESSDEIKGMVADLREGVSRISTIVANLRGFSHPEELMAANCLISEPLESAVRLLAEPFRESSVVFENDVPETLTVRGDKNQLTLVFLNLLKNAIDALSTATISSGDPRQIRVSACAQGADQVEVSVTDNGPGIPTELLTHVFDPFFTTKAPGEGTGLGLSICYRIISAHGGSISANSQPGQGTQFSIRLARVPVVELGAREILPALSA